MNFAELVDAVAVKTGRPDQGTAIKQALREATLWAHLYDFWRRDLVEVPLEYSPALFTGQLAIESDLPGHRKISYWRKWDPLTNGVGDYLKQAEPDALFDQFKCKKQNIFYLAGKNLNWYSSTSDDGHIIGYWKYPTLDANSYDSWIAKDHPFVLVNYASAEIFSSVGQVDVAKDKRQLAMAMLQQVLTSEIESSGR